MKLITRTHGDAAITIPVSWIDVSIATYVGPPNANGHHPTVVVATSTPPKKETLQSLAQCHLAELQQALQDFTLLSHGMIQVTNGRSLYRVSYTFTQVLGDHSLRLQQDQWYRMLDHKLLIITTTAPEADYANYAACLAQIAADTDFAVS